MGFTAVHADRDETVREFWKRRLAQHSQDTYRGRRLAKMPEDLRTYQHIIEDSRPYVIVELGTFAGGSAVWFADQLSAITGSQGRVVTVDLHQTDLNDPRVICVWGDLAAHETFTRVNVLVDGARVMVVDDSGHTFETTHAALDLYSDLVTPGCWFVVEDGVVDEPDLALDEWTDRGVQQAVDEFLHSRKGQRFERRDQALYGLTTNIGGWLYATR